MKNDHIVKGYKGIMDLDLSSIDPIFHKEVVAQHMKDIDEYKREQHERPDKLRYDTAIMHAHNIIELDRKATERVAKETIQLENQKDRQRINIFNRIQENKNMRK